jgi:hypothetical protein
MNRTFAAIAMLVATAAVLRPGAQAPDLDPVVRGVLTRYLRFSANDLSDLLRDRPVKHTLESRAPGEFGAVGAVHVRAPKTAFFDAVRDIVQFKRDPSVLQIGRFSDPPSMGDLAALKIDKDDFDATTCRVHDCGIRLPAEMLRRVQHEIDVNAPNVQEQAAAWLKRALLAHVTAYVTGGPGRVLQYDDGDTPILPVDEFEGVLAHMPEVGALVPGLPDHLAQFPARRVPDAEDFLYWSKEKFGVAPFISVTHVTIVCPSTARTCVMTTKDVYSSRYIDASLALAMASDASDSGDSFFLVYANRSRAHALKGRLSALRRSIVERRARAALDESLKTIKMRLENRR